MDTPAIEISLDGTKIKADDGEWLVYAITREKASPPIMRVSMTEAAMRDVPVKEPRLFCTYWGVGCSFDNGRILEHFHEGNMTYRAPGIQQETPERLG